MPDQRREPTAPGSVGGVDGCRGGWVLCTLPAEGAVTIERIERIDAVVERVDTGELALVGVDMPIGLPDTWGRACDDEARRRLGPRRSTLFATPPRFLLGFADDFEAANAASRERTGRGLSVQAFHLLAKMAELDAALEARHVSRIVECHPESCFVTLAGGPLATSKRTAAGRAERLALLSPHLPPLAGHLNHRPPGVAADDLLDAAAAAWAARRHLAGDAVVLGDGSRDARGFPLQLIA